MHLAAVGADRRAVVSETLMHPEFFGAWAHVTDVDAPWNADYAMPRAEDRPRVIVAFAKPADKLLLSGMLEGGDELAGKAVVIDAPRGKGHIVLFANNPMWRANTQGSYALVMNAILNWDALR